MTTDGMGGKYNTIIMERLPPVSFFFSFFFFSFFGADFFFNNQFTYFIFFARMLCITSGVFPWVTWYFVQCHYQK